METGNNTPNWRLREFRKFEKMNGAEFGELLGLSKSGLSNIENGRALISLPHLETIAKKFPALNLEWLITGKGEMIRVIGSSSDDETNCRDLLELEKEQHNQLKEKFVELKAQLRKDKIDGLTDI